MEALAHCQPHADFLVLQQAQAVVHQRVVETGEIGAIYQRPACIQASQPLLPLLAGKQLLRLVYYLSDLLL
jgi:hypothetical protein